MKSVLIPIFNGLLLFSIQANGQEDNPHNSNTSEASAIEAAEAAMMSVNALEMLNDFDRDISYSVGADDRAVYIATLMENAAEYFQQVFGINTNSPLFILKPEDWDHYAEDPRYGMPHFTQDFRLVVASDDNEFWKSFLPPIELLPPSLASNVKLAYGSDGQYSMRPFFDLLALHELGHAFSREGKVTGQRKWMNELFCNIMLHTYIAEMQHEMLPALETFPQMVVAQGDSEYEFTNLADFERLYSELPGKNYGWYQCNLHMAAKTIYEAGGVETLKTLWTALQNAPKNMNDEAFIEMLRTRVHPMVADVYLKWNHK